MCLLVQILFKNVDEIIIRRIPGTLTSGTRLTDFCET